MSTLVELYDSNVQVIRLRRSLVFFREVPFGSMINSALKSGRCKAYSRGCLVGHSIKEVLSSGDENITLDESSTSVLNLIISEAYS